MSNMPITPGSSPVYAPYENLNTDLSNISSHAPLTKDDFSKAASYAAKTNTTGGPPPTQAERDAASKVAQDASSKIDGRLQVDTLADAITQGKITDPGMIRSIHQLSEKLLGLDAQQQFAATEANQQISDDPKAGLTLKAAAQKQAASERQQATDEFNSHLKLVPPGDAIKDQDHAAFEQNVASLAGVLQIKPGANESDKEQIHDAQRVVSARTSLADSLAQVKAEEWAAQVRVKNHQGDQVQAQGELDWAKQEEGKIDQALGNTASMTRGVGSLQTPGISATISVEHAARKGST